MLENYALGSKIEISGHLYSVSKWVYPSCNEGPDEVILRGILVSQMWGIELIFQPDHEDALRTLWGRYVSLSGVVEDDGFDKRMLRVTSIKKFTSVED